MRKAPGPARCRPTRAASRKGPRALPKGCSCMPQPARHGVSSRSSSPGVTALRPRPDLCGASRTPADNGRCGAGNPGRVAKGVKLASPAADASSGTTRPPCERVGRGARPADAGRKRPDGSRWAVRDVSGAGRQTPARSASGAARCGLSGSRTTTGGGYAQACRDATTWRLSPGPVGARVTPRPARNPGRQAIRRRRDERRRLTRITRAATHARQTRMRRAFGWTATGPTD